MYTGVPVMCLFFLADLTKNWNMLKNFSKMHRERRAGSTTNITFLKLGVEVLKNLLNDNTTQMPLCR